MPIETIKVGKRKQIIDAPIGYGTYKGARHILKKTRPTGTYYTLRGLCGRRIFLLPNPNVSPLPGHRCLNCERWWKLGRR